VPSVMCRTHKSSSQDLVRPTRHRQLALTSPVLVERTSGRLSGEPNNQLNGGITVRALAGTESKRSARGRRSRGLTAAGEDWGAPSTLFTSVRGGWVVHERRLLTLAPGPGIGTVSRCPPGCPPGCPAGRIPPQSMHQLRHRVLGWKCPIGLRQHARRISRVCDFEPSRSPR